MPASTPTIIIIVVIIIGERLARDAWDDPSRQSSQTCDAKPPHEAATIQADRLFLARQSLVDHGFLPAQALKPALGRTTRGGDRRSAHHGALKGRPQQRQRSRLRTRASRVVGTFPSAAAPRRRASPRRRRR
jgi:hypothetical protein